MTLQIAYAFVVVVSSLDGRSDSKRVLVTPVYTGSVQVYVNTTFTRFNLGSKLIVRGHLFAPFPVTSEWSVSTPLGVLVPYKALTSKLTNFTFASTESYIDFPLAFKAGTFTGGNSYSFRLTAYPVGSPKLATFSEITLQANKLPTGGYLVAVPTTGFALVTKFLISTPGWTSDVENLPLRFSFSYTVSKDLSKNYLTLTSPSLKAYTTSTLPPGLSTLENVVTLQSRATDYLLSSATATTEVSVTLEPATDLLQTLDSSLTAAFEVGNINQAYQAVNNVSFVYFVRCRMAIIMHSGTCQGIPSILPATSFISSLSSPLFRNFSQIATSANVVDCSSAPNCTSLNRDHCFKTHGTCSNCFEGYSGNLIVNLATQLLYFDFLIFHRLIT
jgi:REJ domain